MARRRRRHHTAGEAARKRHPWLELLQTSGPFLTLPVVDRVWPSGVPSVPSNIRREARTAVADVLTNRGASRLEAVHSVLTQVLDWNTHLRWSDELPASLAEPVPEHGALIGPDFGFYAEPAPPQDGELEDENTESDDDLVDDSDEESEEDESDEDADSSVTVGPWRMLGVISEWGTHPLARTTVGGWSASPAERLAVLLRARDVPVGIVTDGRWWAIVWAPIGGTTGTAVWDSSLWSDEPESFAAFAALLQRSRFLAVAPKDTLPELLAESLDAQEEVTETLGLQVRDAVELLLEPLTDWTPSPGYSSASATTTSTTGSSR